ncbi:MAG TPA: transglycosylase SLT domain-containing protein [Micropruina sp.]|nr:transglycosylase SLT domain-containing protein [Micropruina sp.]
MVAALALAAGTAGVAQAETTGPVDVTVPAAPPGDERGDLASRDDTRPALQPEVIRALSSRQEVLGRTQTEIAARERALRANEFVKQRDAAEKKVRYAEEVERLGYDPKKTPPRDIAKRIMLDDYEWGEDQFGCLDKIFTQESQWKWNATNPTSGAYGIPQSLPANKMASEGDDWKTNPVTQIKWGLKYIQQRYGTPCQAWSFKRGAGWY